MKTGAQTRIGVILPRSKALRSVKLSRSAKLRLAWMDYYDRCGNAALTCRHFGIHRSTFHKWKARYRPGHILSLEDQSRRPKRTRKPTTPVEVVGLVKFLRIRHPEYSKYKLEVLLKRDYDLKISASTVGRIISRYRLFFERAKKPKRSPSKRRPPRILKPKGLVATKAGQILEFDVKHLRTIRGHKLYAFCAIDIFSKRAYAVVSTSISSKQAVLAWTNITARLGRPEILITDHGSENLGFFIQALSASPTTHYFARVQTPKDKAFVERFIGSLETECLARTALVDTAAEMQATIDKWLAKYHYYRPHAALNYLTPHEFEVSLKEPSRVSTM